MRTAVIVAVFFVAGSSVVAAPATKTSSTKPAGESDGSGPRAALLLMDKMTVPGKPQTALPFYHVTATRERILANHLAEMDAALAYLHKSSTAKFGKDAADSLVKLVNGTTVAEINAARIQVEGNTAQVWFKDSKEPTTLVRVGDEWKISVKQWVRGVQNLPGLRSALSKLAGKVNEISKGIESGRYATTDAAASDLKKAKEEAFEKKASSGADEEEEEDR
jgi:hypothetical protein